MQPRVSHFIKRKPASNLHHATRLASVLGLPLNQSVTINFAKTGCPPGRVSECFSTLRANHFAPWLRRHPRNKKRVLPTYAWVIEAAGNSPGVHWAVHVPQGMIREFRQRLVHWLEAVTCSVAEPGAVHMKPVFNIVGLRRYMLKGMDEVWAATYAVRPVPQGLVVGRRSGFSRNLGPSKRAVAGYKPKRFVRR